MKHYNFMGAIVLGLLLLALVCETDYNIYPIISLM